MIGNELFVLRLVRWLTLVDGTGVLADWHVCCEAFSLITEHLPSVPEPEFVRRLPLKMYTEAMSELVRLLEYRYMVFYNREGTLEALRL